MSYNDRRKFESDVFYEAWVRGYDAERAAQCADDCYWNHRTPEQCVDDYGARVRAEHERQELARMEEEYHLAQAAREHYEQQQEQFEHDAAASPDNAHTLLNIETLQGK
jgi:hypothetical protein